MVVTGDEMAFGRELPDDLTADVLRRLPPRSLVVSRCVCRGWRDLVDGRRLLRADQLPLSVGGLFLHYGAHCPLDFLARPTPPGRGRPSISGGLDFVPDGFPKVVDHCNGLLLCTDVCSFHDYVANPATRRWARLPRRPRARPAVKMGTRRRRKAFHKGQIRCLAYDPAVSPHYEVFSIHPLLRVVRDQHQRKSSYPLLEMEMLAFGYSSATGRWEERLFVPEGGGGGRVVEEAAIADTRVVAPKGLARVVENIADTTVYWRGALYIPYQQNRSLLRISISNANYRLIPMPPRVEFESYGHLTLGRSEKGVYCATGYDWHGLRIFFLNESCGQKVEWELKHSVDFKTFSPKLGALNGCGDQQNGPWMLQDINYHKYHLGNDKHIEVVEDRFEWNSDDDNVLSTEDKGHYAPYMFVLGFHPYKEIVFLNAELRRAVAYHWNTSKFQDLGNICPKYFNMFTGEIETCFIYTPCWMDGGFPEEEEEKSSAN